MSKIPFNRFITTFLLFNKSIPFIVEKLRTFGYDITDEAISDVFSILRGTLPPKYKDLIESNQVLDVNIPGHVEWLKHLEVFEFYDFIIRKGDNIENPPEYFKWCEDCLWAHKYKDVMSLINILLFNDEPYEEISKIIMFKYKKKIGVDALEIYSKMFWDTDSMTAKSALYYCIPFRRSALVVKQLRGGDAEITMVGDNVDTEHDGSDIPFVFHDANYIKWKIGYREISVPTPRDFLNQVKNDSYFKYYESMNMTQSVETEIDEGHDDRLGEFEHKKVRHRNVEESRAKLLKHYLDLYLKADKSIPADAADSTDFFKEMAQTQFDFEEDEKMARIDDLPDVLADISGDMSDMGTVEQ